MALGLKLPFPRCNADDNDAEAIPDESQESIDQDISEDKKDDDFK